MKPNHLLLKFEKDILKKKTALDIGAGNGINSFWLAERNIKVDAIEKDNKNYRTIHDTAEQKKLGIKAHCKDIKNFDFGARQWDIVLLFNISQFLKKSETKDLMPKIQSHLNKNGLIFTVAFTTDDPAFEILKNKNEEIEKNTFIDKNSNVWHFFEHNELKEYFDKSFDILHYNEIIIEDKYPKPHKHGIVEAVVQKNEI